MLILAGGFPKVVWGLKTYTATSDTSVSTRGLQQPNRLRLRVFATAAAGDHRCVMYRLCYSRSLMGCCCPRVLAGFNLCQGRQQTSRWLREAPEDLWVNRLARATSQSDLCLAATMASCRDKPRCSVKSAEAGVCFGMPTTRRRRLRQAELLNQGTSGPQPQSSAIIRNLPPAGASPVSC